MEPQECSPCARHQLSGFALQIERSRSSFAATSSGRGTISTQKWHGRRIMNSGRLVAVMMFVFLLWLGAQEAPVADASAPAAKTEIKPIAASTNTTPAATGKADYVIGPDD